MAAENPNSKRPFKWIQATLGLLLMGLTVATGLYLNSNGFRDRMRHQVIAELERVTGGRVELRSFTWRLSGLEFDVTDLTIHGLEAAGEVPYAHIDHAHVQLKIISVLKRGLGLRELVLDHPVFHLIVYPSGSTNQPRPKMQQSAGPAARLFDVAMDKFQINNGLLLWNDRPVPVNISAENISAGMTYASSPAGYRGTIRTDALKIEYKSSPVVASRAEVDFTLRPDGVDLTDIHWASQHSHFDANGTIRNFQKPRVEGHYAASLDGREVAPLLGAPGLRQGTIALDGNLRYASVDDFFSSGHLGISKASYEASGVRISGVQADSEFSIDPERISLTKMIANALGGRASGNMVIAHWIQSAQGATVSALRSEPPATRPSRITGVATGAARLARGAARKAPQTGTAELTVSGIQLDAAIHAFFPPRNPIQRIRFASSLSGPVKLSWIGTPADLAASGKLEVDRNPSASEAELPLTGAISGAYFARAQRVDVENLNLAARTTRLAATGSLGASSEVKLSLNSTDLTELEPLIQAFGGSSSTMPVVVHGQASFNGTLAGILAAPTLAGHLQAANFDTVLPSNAFTGAPARTVSIPNGAPKLAHWDSFATDLRYGPGSLTLRNAALKRGQQLINGDGNVSLSNGLLWADSSVHAHVSAANIEVADLQALLGVDYQLSGLMDGQMTISGTRNNLRADGRVRSLNGTVYGEAYNSFSAGLDLRGQEIDVRNAVLKQDGGQIAGEGSLNRESRELRFTAKGSGFELAHIDRLQNGKITVAGLAQFDASGTGTLDHPDITAQLSVRKLVLSGEGEGDLTATATTHGPDLHLEAHTNLKSANLNVNGDVQLHDDYPAKIHLQLAKLDFDPLLRVYLAGKLTGHSSISGNLLLQGPLRFPRKLAVTADLEQFSADIQNIALHNDGPFRFSIADEAATIQQMHIVGTDTDITGSGRVELTGARHLDLHGKGQVNLKLIQTVNSGIASSGEMGFTVNATGTVDQPSLTGNVQLTNGSLAFVDLPNGLSEINGTLSFDQNRLRVQKLTAKTGGGNLVLGGYVTYSNGLFFDVTATGRDIRIRYPEGVSSQATADLRLQGTTQNSVLSGDVTITKFGLTQQFDLATYVERAKLPPPPPNPNSLIDNIRLDIHILSTPELRVETSMARLSGDLDLRLRGTLARPSVLGRVNIAEGDVTFNSTTYHLERGDVLFANPVRIEPVIDVEASARVRDYDITLGFHGTPEKLNITYRSEPPLPSPDIISLLAFGRTREESEIQAEQGSQAATEQSFAQTASNAILGEALNSAVSSRVQKLFGISRIKIDPNLGGTEENPNARLTVEQQISRNVTVTYLTNLGQTAEQVFQVEYNINKNISIVAVRDYTGVLAIDLRIRQRKR